MRRAPIRIPAVIIVEERLHVPRHRVVFVGVGAGLDLRSCQIDGQLKRRRRAHHREARLWRKLKRRNRRRMDEHPAAAGQPITRFDRHPANLPCLVVEQEIPDCADLAVARLDRATHETTDGEQHGPFLLKRAQSAARPGADRYSALSSVSRQATFRSVRSTSASPGARGACCRRAHRRSGREEIWRPSFRSSAASACSFWAWR